MYSSGRRGSCNSVDTSSTGAPSTGQLRRKVGEESSSQLLGVHRQTCKHEPNRRLQTGICAPGFKTRNPATQQCFRAGDWTSRQDFGRNATGRAPKSAFRPADDRRCFPGSCPAKKRPGRPMSGPDALLRDMEQVPKVGRFGIRCSPGQRPGVTRKHRPPRGQDKGFSLAGGTLRLTV